MSLESVRIGTPDIQLGRESTAPLPTMTGVTLIASAVTEEQSGDFLRSDIKAPLVVATDYVFSVALMGFASSGQGGYSVGPASDIAGPVQVTAGQAIKLRIPSGSMPSGSDAAVAMAVFVKKGSAATYRITQFAFIDTDGGDFETLVQADALSKVTFSLAEIQGAAFNAHLNDRNPLKVLYDTVPTSTGDVVQTFDTTTVTVSPNNGPDYTIVTARAEGLQFSILSNVLKQVVNAAAGHYGKITATSGETLELGQRALATASTVLSGNRPIKLTMPGDANGPGESLLYLGNLTNNQASISLTLSKNNTAPVQFNLQAAIQDSLLNNQHTVIAYRRHS